MIAKDFLRKELEKIKENFANAIFKYEFLDVDNTHIIETKPQEIFDCDGFVDFRIDLRNNLRMRFPQDSILFVSECSINKIEKAEFVVSNYQVIQPKKYYTLNTGIPNILEIAGENNFALAA